MAVTSKPAAVMNFVSYKLKRLLSEQTGQSKALLANLRRGVGRTPGDMPELWGVLFSELPQELWGKDTPSREEWAIYTALTLFAVHQQGHDTIQQPMNVKDQSLGSALRKLAPQKDSDEFERILRRFNALATSSDMLEAAHHLRGFVQLMRAKGIPLDYTALAADLYYFQFPDGAQRVRLKWGQNFYYIPPKADAPKAAENNADE